MDPAPAKTALVSLIPVAIPYLRETGFSFLLHIKTKSRNRLYHKYDMREILSTKNPNLDVSITTATKNIETKSLILVLATMFHKAPCVRVQQMTL